MMKKEYKSPEMEAIRFEAEDCITTSTGEPITDADVVEGDNPNL